MLLIQLAAVNTELNVLAAMFDAYDCWSWQGGGGEPTPPPECHWEWQTMEASVDGGETWYIAWEGWVRICNNMT
jgi:hypothetical protein